MPIRARSHILEELSIVRFKAALPDHWVYRSKVPDYGIDGEVEIFNADGTATGLTFNVQLRATDNAARANSISLEIDELDYYRSLDVPTAVVRFGNPTDSLFWDWAANIASRVKANEGQKTATHRFSSGNLWAESTPIEIRRTLEVRRALASYSPNLPIPVRIDLTAIHVSSRYQIDRAISGAISESNGAIARAADATSIVEACVRVEPGFLYIGIDTVTGVTFDLEDPTPDEYIASILYALALIFRMQRLHSQAEALARLIMSRELAHHNVDLAKEVCLALANDLPAFARLAVINGLHLEGHNQALIAMTIAKAPRSDASRRIARDIFFSAILDSARNMGESLEAATHYSIGNAYRNENDLLRAIYHYNRARHIRPVYLDTDYYVRELAGLLFVSKHFLAAKYFYQRALKFHPDDPDLRFLFGDALLLSGAVFEAHLNFKIAKMNCSSQRMVREATLKVIFCDRMLAEYGTDTLHRRRSSADSMLSLEACANPETLEYLLANVDALHPLAHFNLGIMRAHSGNYDSALHHFLACGFMEPQDIETWTNAAICALNLEDEVLLLGVLSTAIHQLGSDAYDRFRSHLASCGMELEQLALLDGMAIPLLEEKETNKEGRFTLRMLAGDGYQTIAVI